MRDTLEKVGAVICASGGLALVLLPIGVVLGPIVLAMKAGRGFWSKGTETRISLEERKAWLEFETDPVIKDYLEFTFNFIDED